MLLSVIIPVYNAENHISECLDGLLKQNLTEDEYEILIMDDGSVDSTPAIVQCYVNQNKNIHFFQQNNEGPCSARNALLKKVKGEYVYFMDADDLIAYNSLGVLAHHAKNLSLDLIAFDSMESANVYDFKQDILFNMPIAPEVIDGYQYIEKKPQFRLEVWWYLIKTSFIKKNNLHFDLNKYNRDVLFTLNTFSRAKRIVHIPEILHCYFQSEESIMRSKDLNHRRVLLDNFHTMIQDLTHFIKQIEMKRIPNNKSIVENLKLRRNAFVMYFLAKLVRSGLHAEQAKTYLRKLKAIDVYPLASPSSYQYSSLEISF